MNSALRVFPKISIVIHLFNREALLRETLDSILNQNYPQLELIVVDDGSTDNSWSIVESYGSAIAHKIRLTGKRSSPVEAINVGFARATGEIMTWLNTKNKLWDKSLFLLADIFTTLPEVEWVTGFGSTIDDESRAIRVVRLYKHKYDFLIGKWEVIQQESTFWRRSLWDRTGAILNPAYPWSFDTALWSKFFLHARLYHVNTIIGAYRENTLGQSISQRPTFLKHAYASLHELKSKSSTKDHLMAFLYNCLRCTKPIIRNVPDAIFARIPVLKALCYPCIEFRFKEDTKTWHPFTKLKNPYRVTH